MAFVASAQPFSASRRVRSEPALRWAGQALFRENSQHPQNRSHKSIRRICFAHLWPLFRPSGNEHDGVAKRRRASGRFWRETGAETWVPDIEVLQKDNELTIRAAVPGLKREDVTVDVTDSEVCIQGERKHEREEEREGYYRSEGATAASIA
jgi:HSP20 family molecular chaperone IbpA